MQIKIQIKNRWTGAIKFEYSKENNTLRDTVIECIRQARERSEHADLTDANLTRADLTDANLTDANLTRANLTRADLTRADLTRADLTDADLTAYKNDFLLVLLRAIPEVSALKQHLIEGKINGSVYEGECCCLKGTIANARGCKYNQLDGLEDNPSSPAERWFMLIKTGDTPENNQAAKITLEWIEEFEHLVCKPLAA